MSLTLSGERERLDFLRNEGGGHRWQRVPPTERNGRVHTSTVTVAVFDPTVATKREYPRCDFRIEWFAGSGAGGQHRNKHHNSCRVIHIPTGLRREAQSRSRQNSYAEAFAAITELLDRQSREREASVISANRKTQVGSGQRGDKVRTYAMQRDQVLDHRTNVRLSLSRVMAGELNLLSPR
jgi:peptide chain release factor 1